MNGFKGYLGYSALMNQPPLIQRNQKTPALITDV